jgi:glyoxylase-like metal-dependent hydrolase (beta-lactamase superfamily II)
MLINRRRFIFTSSAALAAGAVHGLPAIGQAPQTPPPAPRFEDLRGGVGVFTMRGGTIGYYVSPDGVVVIDSQYADTAPLCLEGVKQRAARPIDVLFNTHHHADHTGGNKVFRPAVKKIVAHARVPELQRMAAVQAKTEDQQVYADATFTNTWTESIGRETIAAKHYGPGHTGGDAVITFERANVVHMGDLMFHRIQPRIDRPAGASVVNWVKTLEQVVTAHGNDTRYIYGHAAPGVAVTGSKADLLAFRDYLSAALDHVRRQIAAGAAKDAIVGLDALPGFPDVAPLGGRLTASHLLEAVFEELTAR